MDAGQVNPSYAMFYGNANIKGLLPCTDSSVPNFPPRPACALLQRAVTMAQGDGGEMCGMGDGPTPLSGPEQHQQLALKPDMVRLALLRANRSLCDKLSSQIVLSVEISTARRNTFDVYVRNGGGNMSGTSFDAMTVTIFVHHVCIVRGAFLLMIMQLLARWSCNF